MPRSVAPAVGEAESFPLQPATQLRTQRMGQIVEAEVLLDRSELVVTRRGPSGEIGNHVGIDADLFGDMVEHDRRQHFAAAKVATRIAQAAKLQRILSAGQSWNAEECQDFANEYGGYLIHAASQLRRSASETEIVDYLVQIETEHMGLGERPNSRKRAEAVVAAIQADKQLWTYADD